ncbi:sensor histidine kinase [Actinocatenispora sera]|nr:sensor histidine kinase [Actinocatenispora sera]
MGQLSEMGVVVASEQPRSGAGPEGALHRPDRRPASWEDRFSTIYRLLPYVLAAAAVLLAMVSGFGAARMLWIGGAALVTVAWVCWFETLHPQWERERPALATFSLLVRLALTALLVVLNPWWGLFAWLGFVDFFRANLLGGRITTGIGVAVTAALLAGTQVGGFQNVSGALVGAYLVMLLLNLVLAGTMGASFTYVAVRNEQRRVALVELAEANRKLSETLRENAGLHAQLLTQAREAGVRDERARLAREIHDTIAQGLTGIITQLQAAQRVPDSTGYVQTALGLARDSLGEARRSVQALRPPQLEDATLPVALRRTIEAWAEREAPRATLVTTGTARPLHPEIEATLLRIAQEALANVARHARAARVGVTLSYMEDVISLDVRDDGVGFDPAAATPADGCRPDPAARGGAGPGDGGSPVDDAVVAGRRDGGFGLIGMRQRVARVAGELTIESEPGSGTAVSATVPAVPAGAAA